VRIIHPNHPLLGQTAVIKRTLRPSRRQPARYLISHPQIGTASIPQVWAIPVPDTAESLPSTAPPTTAPIPPVTLHTLLALAKLVQTMQSHSMEEHHDPAPTAPCPPHLGQPTPPRQQELTRLLAALLTQYLAAHQHQTANQPPQETPHERTSPNP
jgi:hypothetical protein